MPNKFQTGETVEPKSNAKQMVIIESLPFIRRYATTNTNVYVGDYRPEQLYYVYDIENCVFSWWTEDFLIPFCQNTERGKKILMAVRNSLCDSIGLDKSIAKGQFLLDLKLIVEERKTTNA